MATPFLFGVVVLLSTCIKCLLIPSYISTDFEVHRNWLALTSTLKPSEWYFEATSQWTLDYPPLFAWFEYALGCLALTIIPVDAQLFRISSQDLTRQRQGLELTTLYFQRASVMASDFVFYYGVWEYVQTWPTQYSTTETKTSTHKLVVICCCTLFNVGLLFVDHIHFQYNAMLLGILVLSMARIRQGRDLEGAFFYAVLLMFKHIYLYVSLVYFVYLLRHYCFLSSSQTDSSPPRSLRKRSISDIGERSPHSVFQAQEDSCSSQTLRSFSIYRLVKLSVLVLSVFGVSLGSVLVDATSRRSPGDVLRQIAKRLFPVQRGLTHAYWAPNVWALYAGVDKILTMIACKFLGFSIDDSIGSMSNGLVQEASFRILPDVSPIMTVLLTLCFMFPVLCSMWHRPHTRSFTNGLAYCMLCSYMCGYHVHEKAILQVSIPLALGCCDSVKEGKLYFLVELIGIFSLFPLFYTTTEWFTKYLLYVCFVSSLYILIRSYLFVSLKQRRIQTRSILQFTMLERVYIVGLLFGSNFFVGMLTNPLVLQIVTRFVPSLQNSSFLVALKTYEFIGLMNCSVTCSIGLIYCWYLCFKQYETKMTAIASYTKSPAPSTKYFSPAQTRGSSSLHAWSQYTHEISKFSLD